MQNINSVFTTTYKFGLLSSDTHLISKTDAETVQILKSIKQLNTTQLFRVLAIDYEFIHALTDDVFLSLKNKFQRLILIFNHPSDAIVPYLMKDCAPDEIIFKPQYTVQVFFEQDSILTEIQQNMTYLHLAGELNAEYENIKKELENKLDETRNDLISSRQKILDTNLRMEAMRRILYSITQESDLHRIETILNELVPASSKATWVKIVPSDLKSALETELKSQLNTTFKSFDFPQHFIFFIKGDQKAFKKDDLNLFSKITDIIAINYNRELNYNTLKRTENIVRKAFEEFNHPLAVINSNYEIVQSNSAFNQNQSEKGFCHEVLFNSKTPCVNCHLGTKYTTQMNDLVFDVYSNPIAIDNNPTKLWINLYKNKTEEHYFEQHLNQTVKMKELGIISSSIAHELNNPIGGVLSYLQLVQMDLPKDSPFLRDIQLMIDTTLRMKKIIEDLLVFSRSNNFKDVAIYDLYSLITESLSIHEIHFRNENIKIVQTQPDLSPQLQLSKSAFRDALHFIFSFYIEKMRLFRKTSSQKTGLIEVKISSTKTQTKSSSPVVSNYYVEFQGNCGFLNETEKSKDISLLALSKTLTDQSMHLEIAAPKENWISLKVIIPKSGN